MERCRSPHRVGLPIEALFSSSDRKSSIVVRSCPLRDTAGGGRRHGEQAEAVLAGENAIRRHPVNINLGASRPLIEASHSLHDLPDWSEGEK